MSGPTQTFSAFAIGDTIFVPHVGQKEIEVQCPDCLGSKTWRISTPAGTSKEIACPRCGGGERSWLLPKRYERSLEIKETTVSEVNIRHGRHTRDSATFLSISYSTAPYIGHVDHAKAFGAREEAAAAGDVMMAKAAEREHEEWRKQREREEARAGHDIIQALNEEANRKLEFHKSNVEALREKLFDAIRYPTLYGPKINSRSYGGAEISSEAMAEWLQKLLGDAGLETWSESELHEAMCHC